MADSIPEPPRIVIYDPYNVKAAEFLGPLHQFTFDDYSSKNPMRLPQLKKFYAGYIVRSSLDPPNTQHLIYVNVFLLPMQTSSSSSSLKSEKDITSEIKNFYAKCVHQLKDSHEGIQNIVFLFHADLMSSSAQQGAPTTSNILNEIRKRIEKLEKSKIYPEWKNVKLTPFTLNQGQLQRILGDALCDSWKTVGEDLQKRKATSNNELKYAERCSIPNLLQYWQLCERYVAHELRFGFLHQGINGAEDMLRDPHLQVHKILVQKLEFTYEAVISMAPRSTNNMTLAADLANQSSDCIRSGDFPAAENISSSSPMVVGSTIFDQCKYWRFRGFSQGNWNDKSLDALMYVIGCNILLQCWMDNPNQATHYYEKLHKLCDEKRRRSKDDELFHFFLYITAANVVHLVKTTPQLLREEWEMESKKRVEKMYSGGGVELTPKSPVDHVGGVRLLPAPHHSEDSSGVYENGSSMAATSQVIRSTKLHSATSQSLATVGTSHLRGSSVAGGENLKSHDVKFDVGDLALKARNHLVSLAKCYQIDFLQDEGDEPQQQEKYSEVFPMIHKKYWIEPLRSFESLVREYVELSSCAADRYEETNRNRSNVQTSWESAKALLKINPKEADRKISAVINQVGKGWGSLVVEAHKFVVRCKECLPEGISREEFPSFAKSCLKILQSSSSNENTKTKYWGKLCSVASAFGAENPPEIDLSDLCSTMECTLFSEARTQTPSSSLGASQFPASSATKKTFWSIKTTVSPMTLMIDQRGSFELKLTSDSPFLAANFTSVEVTLQSKRNWNNPREDTHILQLQSIQFTRSEKMEEGSGHEISSSPGFNQKIVSVTPFDFTPCHAGEYSIKTVVVSIQGLVFRQNFEPIMMFKEEDNLLLQNVALLESHVSPMLCSVPEPDVGLELHVNPLKENHCFADPLARSFVDITVNITAPIQPLQQQPVGCSFEKNVGLLSRKDGPAVQDVTASPPLQKKKSGTAFLKSIRSSFSAELNAELSTVEDTVKENDVVGQIILHTEIDKTREYIPGEQNKRTVTTTTTKTAKRKEERKGKGKKSVKGEKRCSVAMVDIKSPECTSIPGDLTEDGMKLPSSLTPNQIGGEKKKRNSNKRDSFDIVEEYSNALQPTSSSSDEESSEDSEVEYNERIDSFRQSGLSGLGTLFASPNPKDQKGALEGQFPSSPFIEDGMDRYSTGFLVSSNSDIYSEADIGVRLVTQEKEGTSSSTYIPGDSSSLLQNIPAPKASDEKVSLVLDALHVASLYDWAFNIKLSDEEQQTNKGIILDRQQISLHVPLLPTFFKGKSVVQFVCCRGRDNVAASTAVQFEFQQPFSVTYKDKFFQNRRFYCVEICNQLKISQVCLAAAELVVDDYEVQQVLSRGSTLFSEESSSSILPEQRSSSSTMGGGGSPSTKVKTFLVNCIHPVNMEDVQRVLQPGDKMSFLYELLPTPEFRSQSVVPPRHTVHLRVYYASELKSILSGGSSSPMNPSTEQAQQRKYKFNQKVCNVFDGPIETFDSKHTSLFNVLIFQDLKMYYQQLLSMGVLTNVATKRSGVVHSEAVSSPASLSSTTSNFLGTTISVSSAASTFYVGIPVYFNVLVEVNAISLEEKQNFEKDNFSYLLEVEYDDGAWMPMGFMTRRINLSTEKSSSFLIALIPRVSDKLPTPNAYIYSERVVELMSVASGEVTRCVEWHKVNIATAKFRTDIDVKGALDSTNQPR